MLDAVGPQVLHRPADLLLQQLTPEEVGAAESPAAAAPAKPMMPVSPSSTETPNAVTAPLCTRAGAHISYARSPSSRRPTGTL